MLATIGSESMGLELRPQTFSRRELLPLSPDILWLIDRGIVRTRTWNDEGTIITLGYWGAKDVVGQKLSRLNPYQIECLTSVEALPCSPSHWHLLTNALITSARQREELLHISRSGKVRHCLAQLLQWLGAKFGRDVSAGYLIDLRLTHQELAEAIGTTRVTVTRLLKLFEQEKLISRIRGHIVILPKLGIMSLEIREVV